MGDFELVVPIGVRAILAGGCWIHLSFKAKLKDDGDASWNVYFAETDMPRRKVTCLTVLDIDLSSDTSSFKQCCYCHSDPEQQAKLSVGGSGCVYHPVDGGFHMGASKQDRCTF